MSNKNTPKVTKQYIEQYIRDHYTLDDLVRILEHDDPKLNNQSLKTLKQPMDPMMMAQVMIQTAINNHVSLTVSALTRIQWLFVCEYIDRTNHYPFDTNIKFKAWDYGPAIDNVYHQFQNYGCLPIKDATAQIIILDDKGYPKLIEPKPDRNQLDSTMNQIIDTYLVPFAKCKTQAICKYAYTFYGDHHIPYANIEPNEVKFNNPNDTLVDVYNQIKQKG